MILFFCSVSVPFVSVQALRDEESLEALSSLRNEHDSLVIAFQNATAATSSLQADLRASRNDTKTVQGQLDEVVASLQSSEESIERLQGELMNARSEVEDVSHATVFFFHPICVSHKIVFIYHREITADSWELTVSVCGASSGQC